MVVLVTDITVKMPSMNPGAFYLRENLGFATLAVIQDLAPMAHLHVALRTFVTETVRHECTSEVMKNTL